MLFLDNVLEWVVDPLNTYNEVEDKHAKKKIDSFFKISLNFINKKKTYSID
jgi:hypothetical protein